MPIFIRKTIILVFSISLLCVSCFADSLPLENGISFGMSPEAVISIEEKRGNYPQKNGQLYDGDKDFQLYFADGTLYNMSYSRMEYDFTKQDKTLYQFYYCTVGEKDYSLFEAKLSKQYKSQGYKNPNESNIPVTPLYKQSRGYTKKDKSAIKIIKENHWIIQNQQYDLLIDLWLNEYNVVFLVFASAEHNDSISYSSTYNKNDEFQTLKKNDKNNNVTELQQLLYNYKYYTAGINGVYDTNTIKAVKDFQVNNAIKETGQCDIETWIIIHSKDVIYQQMVYKSKNGHVYHSYPYCSGMKTAQAISLSNALRKNLYPCEHCH